MCTAITSQTVIDSTGAKPSRAPGTVICAEGEQGRCCYLLLSGSVDVVKRLPNGTSHVIATIRQHQFFGEVALIDSAPRSASCVAHDACEVARFERAEFDRLMQGGSVFAVRFASSIATSEKAGAIFMLATQPTQLAAA